MLVWLAELRSVIGTLHKMLMEVGSQRRRGRYFIGSRALFDLLLFRGPKTLSVVKNSWTANKLECAYRLLVQDRAQHQHDAFRTEVEDVEEMT